MFKQLGGEMCAEVPGGIRYDFFGRLGRDRGDFYGRWNRWGRRHI